MRFGLGIRALRRRRGWRQRDLADAAGVSQGLVSLIERGHGDRVSIRTLVAVANALDARLGVQLRWRAGDLDRLLDADHALLSATFIRVLAGLGWESRVEVTYALGRFAGSIDILAWHAATRTLLVIEIKTEIPSAEATLRKLDEKGRIAAGFAKARFGWEPRFAARLLVVQETSTNRRRVAGARGLFDASLPWMGASVRHWLRTPSGSLAGRLFLSPTNRSSGIHRHGGRHRVRRQSVP